MRYSYCNTRYCINTSAETAATTLFSTAYICDTTLTAAAAVDEHKAPQTIYWNRSGAIRHVGKEEADADAASAKAVPKKWQ